MRPIPLAIVDVLAGGGEMGEPMRAVDRALNPMVGRVETWPRRFTAKLATALRRIDRP